VSGKARRGGLARGAAELVKNVARRTGLLPAGTPDRLSDDEKVLDGRIEATVMVYFPDTRVNLYQLRQWYAPLLALNERHSVILVLQDSRAARLVRQELDLPAVVIAHYGRLDELLSRSEVKLALYVNHNPLNFAALRFTSLAHVYLTHGDSDKGVSVSNQSKAYDFIFVPGQAAVDRMQAYTMFYDAAPHCVLIGCPQLDVDRPTAAAPPPASRPTVLYAPTWEGAQPSMAYGSVASHGPAIVRALLADGRFTVAYRPHPLNGISSAGYGDADAEVRRLVTEAAAQDPRAAHRIETERTVNDSLAGADLLVSDISAMAIEWLPSGKPMVITEPVSSAVVTARTRMLDVVPRLSVTDLPALAALVADQLDRDPARAARSELIDYYLGDTSPGAATKSFLDACTRVISARDQAWGAVLVRGPAGP
jgi:CDP-Glycerol:Poly(glycerophosphate) glycerophosphotransferase